MPSLIAGRVQSMRIIKQFSLYKKLLISFLFIILMPLLITGYMNYNNFKHILEREVTDKLVAIADSKILEISNYVRQAESNTMAAANMPFIINAMEQSKRLQEATADAPERKSLYDELRPSLIRFQTLFQYHDMLLVSPDGTIVFTVSQEADLGTNILTGPYKDSGLSHAFIRVRQSLATAVSDFNDYPPTGAAAVFIVSPIVGAGGFIGAVALQVDSQRLYEITSNYKFLGTTGEILLCVKIGNEVTFANPLRHDPQAAFARKVALGAPVALPAQQAVQQADGVGPSIDYRGEAVLAVWRYLPVPRWGMVVKIDAHEAYAPVRAVRNWSLLLGLIALCAGMLTARAIAKSISRPIHLLQRGVEIVGSGDLDYQVGMSSDDEIGRLSRAFDAMTENLKKITASRDELNNVTIELERSNQELQQFAYVASHDLQEPLRMVAGFTKLLGRRYKDKLDQDAQEFIHYAVDGSMRMQKLIDDLLSYSRVGTHHIPFEPVDCNYLLDQAISNLQVAIEENHAVITRGNLPTITCNGSQMVQLFQNLISNAIKFRGADSPRVHFAAERRGEEWLFACRDNGIGIDIQYHDRIFKIFQRLHSRDEYAGTGIGLALCMKIVELHKGRIWMESELGKGATFYFTLPLQGDDAGMPNQ